VHDLCWHHSANGASRGTAINSAGVEFRDMSDSDCLLHRQDGASNTHSASPQHTEYGETSLISPIQSRKRIRCESDPKDSSCSQPPEKMMYKGPEDRIDTAFVIEGLVCSPNFSPLISPTQRSVSELLPSWKRDDQFYLEDGSCILLVEDTLFNASYYCSSFQYDVSWMLFAGPSVNP